jgi:hypothetical protein
LLTRTANESDQLGRAAAIVADWDDVVELALSALDYLIEHIDETVPTGTYEMGRKRQILTEKGWCCRPGL